MSSREGHIVVERRFVGGPERRGEIVEVLGESPHARYRVRWEDGRESIVYPGAGTTIGRAVQPTAEQMTRKRPSPPPRPAGKATPEKAAVKRTLQASAGDRLVIRAHHLGEPPRDAEILEVLGEDGSPPYRVRWEDNSHEVIVFPGPDAFVEHFAHVRKRRPKRKTSR